VLTRCVVVLTHPAGVRERQHQNHHHCSKLPGHHRR
jgi:hypothetical protein